MVAHHPQRGESPIAVWLTGRVSSGLTYLEITTTRGWSGSPDIQGKHVLVRNIDEPANIILAVRFDGRFAYSEVGNLKYDPLETTISATGYPSVFSIVYNVSPTAKLTVYLDEVRLEPATVSPRCTLPSSVH